ncbi:MAG: hypothetical protein P1U56_13485 [Saprospiraceae bacterium]|nr:hypothetical protein [Saprospiraceae bacterium]
MINETVIEGVINHFQNDDDVYINALAEAMDAQPALLAFLKQESVDILLEEEKDILWYIVLVIIHSIHENGIDLIEINDDKLSENEEKNWTVFQEQPRGPFRDRVTVFFENYAEEDLLAFVEDTLELDEESPVTPVGREVIFIASKSIIDTLLA